MIFWKDRKYFNQHCSTLALMTSGPGNSSVVWAILCISCNLGLYPLSCQQNPPFPCSCDNKKMSPNIKKCPSGGKFTHGWEPLIIQYLEHNKNFKSQIRIIVVFNVGKNDNWRLVAQTIKNSPAKQESWVQSLVLEDLLEKGMPTHSSILAWRTARTAETGGLQWGHQESDATELLTCACTCTHAHTQREVNPLTNWSQKTT